MPAVVDLGPHLTTVVIRPAFGMSWTVLAVLENWTTPRYHNTVGTPVETKRFKVSVSGPLPGDPSAAGEFVMPSGVTATGPAGDQLAGATWWELLVGKVLTARREKGGEGSASSAACQRYPRHARIYLSVYL